MSVTAQMGQRYDRPREIVPTYQRRHVPQEVRDRGDAALEQTCSEFGKLVIPSSEPEVCFAPASVCALLVSSIILAQCNSYSSCGGHGVMFIISIFLVAISALACLGFCCSGHIRDCNERERRSQRIIEV